MKEQIIIPNKIMPKVKKMANKWHISKEKAFIRLMGYNTPRAKKIGSVRLKPESNHIILRGIIHPTPRIKRIIIVEVA